MTHLGIKSAAAASRDVNHPLTNHLPLPPNPTMFALSFAAAAVAATLAHAKSYAVTDTFIGSSFLTNFDHQAIADPTHGRVK